jgi:hypothetical protein
MSHTERRLCGAGSHPSAEHQHGKRESQTHPDGTLVYRHINTADLLAVAVIDGTPTLQEPGDTYLDWVVAIDGAGSCVAVSMSEGECATWATDTAGMGLEG